MRYFFIVILFSLLSCNAGTESALKIQELNLQLLEKEKQIKLLETVENRFLVHLVYFNLKPEANGKEFIEALKKMATIPVVKDLEVGHFKDLSDKRAMVDFEVIMQMAFDSEEDYKTYQAHPVHLELKKLATDFVAAPPATYDYIVIK